MSSGLQADIGIYLAENNKLPKTDDLTGDDGNAKNIADAAQRLEGKYIAAKGVSVIDKGVISITYTGGAVNGGVMTLTPNRSGDNDGGQVASWTCDLGKKSSLKKDWLPSSCQ